MVLFSGVGEVPTSMDLQSESAAIYVLVNDDDDHMMMNHEEKVTRQPPYSVVYEPSTKQMPSSFYLHI